ncbi:hypothetical protein FF80_02850 [Devosia sp. LC5]|uniref:nucleotidyltransferase domain-containing protein n=1 Tax=Devosia sp. LC5 TaxID=1502724 RepID=UPI0004E38B42|nr:nucleotidyltransferase domain-containing protein [Devosia sp. LC5]KFC65386.1 hypothetical protein FF80_02850 [Devosia sp. LC5]
MPKNNLNSIAERALAAARKSLASHFDGAALAFVSGSIIRGAGTPASDIDLVVVYARLERAWRESFIEDGFPVEALVHDRQTLAYYFDQDAKNGRPIMAHIVATGIIIGVDADLAHSIQTEAAAILARGPMPLAGPGYDRLRYLVSDLADDLRGDRPAAEISAIAAQLYQQLADLMLLGRGTWSGNGKWAPRLLLKLDAGLAQAFESAFRQAVTGNSAPLLALADAELARHGGHYFAGYRQDAPLDARLAG